ncbi:MULTISPECIES: HtaA domain-containing protein [Microbacterium]|uniref:Htaa domain-containing protein n=1 Tax=Microbacterium wangchenii TaxID=2541726 RepID=A0ABX5SW16_9MICO|nr:MULTISPECIES: HtaA domain-containing protein [Microbacterium]MCK6066059.1 HtaA domain-containing protein [Microbacterium sp. EYE_512]QBR90344.1 hypothetical protein E4K62_17655 [Microbacterium wangchenii]TXK11640.1 hypothetical protein FVP99_14570 [Microbacterium wangchenii]
MVDVSGTEVTGPPPADASGVVPGLYWGVRDSFLRYVLGNPDGQLYGDDGVETDGDGMFRFPLRTLERSGPSWRIGFGGEVRFAAHFGMLDVALRHPVVELDESGGLLSVDGPNGASLPIVRLEWAAPVLIEGRWVVFPPLSTTLTEEGVAVFGDVYAAGTAFDDIRVALPADAVPEDQ